MTSRQNKRPRLGTATALMFCWALSWPAAHGAGTPGAGDEGLVAPGESVDQAAANWYAEGMAQKEAALAKEARADDASADARERLLAEANAHYQSAAAAHGKALKLHLGYYQAANELGFALRKTGDFQKAIGAYNFALTIKPDFYPAIEYRGEAYLALGRTADAREAYMTLFRNEPGLAARLLTAMEAHSLTASDPELSDWVAERKALAALLPTDGTLPADW